MKKLLFQFTKVIPLVLLLCFNLSCQKQVEEGITEEEAKALIDRYLEIWNGGNLALVEEIIDPEYVAHDSASPEDIVGIEGFKGWITSTRISFSDFNVTSDEMIVKGNNILTRWTATGTNTGPLISPQGELPPTGKKFRVSGFCLSRVVNGKFKEDFNIYNVLDMMLQLGFTLTPPAPPPSPEKK